MALIPEIGCKIPVKVDHGDLRHRRPCRKSRRNVPLPKRSIFRRVNSRKIPVIFYGSFLRRILPENFDTGDLIVVLLLLLMAGDCQEDKNNAILTIALYFLM